VESGSKCFAEEMSGAVEFTFLLKLFNLWLKKSSKQMRTFCYLVPVLATRRLWSKNVTPYSRFMCHSVI